MTHSRGGRIRLLLAAFLSVFLPLHAFFPVPDPLVLEMGATGEVVVHGSDEFASVALQSIGMNPVIGLSHDLKGTRSGPGFVIVKITGHIPGTYVVTFNGKNNGQTVQGSITVMVNFPPATSGQNLFFATAGDPVNTRSGEYFGMEAVDLNLGGPMPLVFARYVASSLDGDDLVDEVLGKNRSHNFASKIVSPVGTNLKKVILPTGKMLLFQKAGTKWALKNPPDVPFQLVEAGTSLLLGHPATKQIWTYDAAGNLTKIEDSKGNAHTLAYTAGKLGSISDGLGRVINISQSGDTISTVTGVTGAETREVAFSYTSGVLTSVTDYGTHVTTYANSGGRPTGITRPQGNTLFTQTYTSGKVTSQTERGTDTSTLSYGAGITTFTDPANETLVDHYDTNGNLTSHVDQEGGAITMTYDSAGRRSSVTDRLGNKITMLYHAASGLPAAIINTEGGSTLFTYKARTLSGLTFHDLVKVTYPDASSRSFTYDARGNLTQLTDQTGKTWKHTFNTRGQVLTSLNPLGGLTTNTYDAFGNLATTQPPDTGSTSFAYDARHRLILITRPGGATVSITYSIKDLITSITDERGKTYSYAYDSNNRLTSITDPDNQTTTLGRDVLDRVTSLTDRLGKAATVAFDSRRQISSITDRNGNTVQMHYDSRQRLASLEDAEGEHWPFGYDHEGRLTQAQTPVNPPASQKLNKLGYAVQVMDPLSSTLRFTRDALQRVTQVFDPLGRQTTYGYDKRGRLINVTKQGTGTVKYDRDALGNITKITDPNGGAWSTAYLKSGRAQKVTDPLGRSMTFTYDSRGRTSGVTFADSSTCTLAYDAGSHLTGAVFSAGPDLAYTYDNLGRLTSANDVLFEHDAEGRLTNCEQNGSDFTATYDDGGRLLTVSYLNALFSVTYAYDSRNRLTGVTDSAGTVITMGYDHAGRLTSQTRTPGIDGTYTYDNAGRLTRIQEGGIIDLSYQLNPASEVTDVDYTAPTLPAVTAGSQFLKFGKAGEITTSGHVYDLRGRLTAAPGGKTYQWDGASRLTQAGTVSLTYNGLGDSLTRTENSNTTRYYHHYALGLAPIVYEDLPTGSDRVYVWTPNGRLLYSVDLGSGDPVFYHFDRMGSTLALTDKSDAVTDSYAYGPYGEPLGRTGTSTQPFTYMGAYGVRQEGHLHQMRARYYDPMTARFLSRDPKSPRLGDPESTHRYAYANQNPMLYIDPRGTEVTIGSNGRFHLAGDDDLNFTSRVRIEFSASGETDGGLTFGGRIRLQHDEPPEESGELDAASIYAEASGFRVEAGQTRDWVDGVVSSPQVPTNAGTFTISAGLTGKASGGMGIFADYSVGDLAARLAMPDKQLTAEFNSLATMFNAEFGYIGTPGGAPASAPTPKGVVTGSVLYGGRGIGDDILEGATLGGFGLAVPAADEEEFATGIGACYDLGGATISGSIEHSWSNNYADIGLNFSF